MHGFTPFYTSPYAMAFLAGFLPFIIVVAVWSLVLKGFALWYAARNGQRNWFIALLILNTIGIVEIIYLVWYRKGSHPAPHPHHAPAHHS